MGDHSRVTQFLRINFALEKDTLAPLREHRGFRVFFSDGKCKTARSLLIKDHEEPMANILKRCKSVTHERDSLSDTLVAWNRAGCRAAGQATACSLVVLLLADHAAARRTAAVEARLGTMSSATRTHPYAEDFPRHTVQVAPASPALVVERLNQCDFGFIAWCAGGGAAGGVETDGKRCLLSHVALMAVFETTLASWLADKV